MTTKATDTKLARRLQKRGKWDSYSSCLREVRKLLDSGHRTMAELKAIIDAGQLDPK